MLSHIASEKNSQILLPRQISWDAQHKFSIQIYVHSFYEASLFPYLFCFPKALMHANFHWLFSALLSNWQKNFCTSSRTIFNCTFSFCLSISFSYRETFCLLSSNPRRMICGVCMLNNPLNSSACISFGNQLKREEWEKIGNYEIGGILHTLFSPYMEIVTTSLSLEMEKRGKIAGC
jgi:hypothetical protein